MDKKVLIGCFLVLMLTPISFASTDTNDVEKIGTTTPTIEMEWNATFGGDEWDAVRSIIQTTDGGFALAGRTASYGAGGADFWLVKTDANGQHEWNQTYGGTGDEIASSIIQTADGGFVLTGHTDSYGAGGNDFWLVKTNANGQHEWNNTFGGIDDEIFRSATQTEDGGFALTGGTWSYGAGDQDFWLVKTNASGQYEWNKTYGGTTNDRGLSITQTADGGLALAGGTTSYGAGGTDYWLIKTDANGQHEWNSTFGGPDRDDFVNTMAQTKDGGFALAGGFMSFSGFNDVWLVKTNASGKHEWNRTFGGQGLMAENCLSVVQSADEGFALAGWTESYGAGGEDMWLVKTDANGELELNKTFGGPADDWANSMIQTADGGFALAGATEVFRTDSSGYGLVGNYDFWLVKTRGSENTTTTTTTVDTTTTTTTVDTTTTTQSSPFWTLEIILMSLTVIIVRNKRKKS